MTYKAKGAALVEQLPRILDNIAKRFVTTKVLQDKKIREVERRIHILEENFSSYDEFNRKRLTERINVGNDKDFIYELAKRVEKLEEVNQ